MMCAMVLQRRCLLFALIAAVFTQASAIGQPPKRDASQGAARPPTVSNVSYGPHERNVLDFWKADVDGPRPLLVFIHGGGFLAGDKSQVAPRMVSQMLDAGISLASINYRYSTTQPFPGPMHDGARAIQFLRTKAPEWNVDPEKIAAYGGSAGAGISMWLAFHNDLAQPSSDDPILRQSSRLACAGSIGGQSTYDPLTIREWIGGRAWEHPALLAFYGMKSFDEVDDPKWKPIFDEASAITYLTADDPPIFMIYSEPNEPLPSDARPGQGIHHPIFGHKLKEKMDALGIECIYRHNDDGKSPSPQDDMASFFKRHLLDTK
ncbi:MAG TPA: alpha/beta hydrolase [Pirellulales bacterium]|nr:alpha/beta hydrolase [Pirellulales bacterium]